MYSILIILAQLPTPSPFPTPSTPSPLPEVDLSAWDVAPEAIGVWNMLPPQITMLIQATILIGILLQMAMLFIYLSDKFGKRE